MQRIFVREEESGTIRVTDNMHVVVGGMIAAKTVNIQGIIRQWHF